MRRAGPASAWAQEALDSLEARGLRRSLEPVEGAQGAVVETGGVRLVNFSSNDYLGLAASPRLAGAVRSALEVSGTGAGASRLIVGDLAAHRQLEAALAAAMRTEAALVFSSGYAANVGLLSTIAGPEDELFSDALNHASIVDGCRLSRAKVSIYPHGDVAALDSMLAVSAARRKIVVTESVFSMDGDQTPILDILASVERHGAALVLDEAHAFGVLGSRGMGLADALGVEGRVEVRVATLGKAAGAAGAFVACSSAVRDWLVNRARSFVFSTAPAPLTCVAAVEGLRMIEQEPALRARLWANVARFAAGLRTIGVEAAGASAIFPVRLGTPERALDASRRLRDRGVLVKAIRPPTVPEGTSRLRFSLSAAHAPDQVDQALEAIESVGIAR